MVMKMKTLCYEPFGVSTQVRLLFTNDFANDDPLCEDFTSTDFLDEMLLRKPLGWANRPLCFLNEPVVLGGALSLLLDVVLLADRVILLGADFLVVGVSLGH